jgi:hypothetical protein
MNLNEAQQKAVVGWITDGLKLSDVQNRLATEFGLRLTYIEVRFLVDDLKLKPKDPDPPKAVEVAATPGQPGKPDAASPTAPEPPEPKVAGNVSVTVDQVARPGSLVSGSVTFSDGMNADWYLDQSGRMGVVPRQQGYKPSATDVEQFQMALERELAKLGL